MLSKALMREECLDSEVKFSANSARLPPIPMEGEVPPRRGVETSGIEVPTKPFPQDFSRIL